MNCISDTRWSKNLTDPLLKRHTDKDRFSNISCPPLHLKNIGRRFFRGILYRSRVEKDGLKFRNVFIMDAINMRWFIENRKESGAISHTIF